MLCSFDCQCWKLCEVSFETKCITSYIAFRHWRIYCEKKLHGKVVFNLDGKQYDSLDQIVKSHGISSGNPLKLKQVNEGQPSVCWLGAPLVRQSEPQDFYSTF